MSSSKTIRLFQAFFFRIICQSNSCLCHLPLPPRDPAVTSSLREPTVYYTRPSLCSKLYCSTFSFGLLNFHVFMCSLIGALQPKQSLLAFTLAQYVGKPVRIDLFIGPHCSANVNDQDGKLRS